MNCINYYHLKSKYFPIDILPSVNSQMNELLNDNNITLEKQKCSICQLYVGNTKDIYYKWHNKKQYIEVYGIICICNKCKILKNPLQYIEYITTHTNDPENLISHFLSINHYNQYEYDTIQEIYNIAYSLYCLIKQQQRIQIISKNYKIKKKNQYLII